MQHVLKGCAHGAWCYDGKGQCQCPGVNVQGYGSLMDTISLPFIAKHLGLALG